MNASALRAASTVLAALLAQWCLRLAWQPVPFAPYAIGDIIIRKTPGDIATTAIERFGSRASDLLTFAVVAALVAAGVAARAAVPRTWASIAGAASLAAAAADPVPTGFTPALAAAGIAALAAWGTSKSFEMSTHRDPDQRSRRILVTGAAGALTIAMIGGTAVAARLRTAPRARISASRVVLNAEGLLPDTPGLSPQITSPADHYVVDIDLNRPVIDGAAWRLRVSGEVASPRSFTLGEIRSMPSVEQPILMHCVSNPVGGKLIGNATWTGFPLSGLLATVAPLESAASFVAESADGYEEVISLGDAPGVFLVFGMGGKELPLDHGFPVRLLFPGRYGMRSVKWLTSLRLQSKESEGWWARRGWDQAAVMRTGARFDTPRKNAKVPGTFIAAGVAWAGTRAVSAVEVSADDGRTWRAATVEPAAGPLAWQRWRLECTLAPGQRVLAVRTKDGAGLAQEPEERFPHPSGASGYHRIKVHVQ